MYQITSKADEVFISTATVDNIDIIDQITATNLKATGNVVTAIDSVGEIQVSTTANSSDTTY